MIWTLEIDTHPKLEHEFQDESEQVGVPLFCVQQVT